MDKVQKDDLSVSPMDSPVELI